MTIVGTLHIYETRRVGMIGPKTEKDSDRVKFDFADNDPIEVIKMLESVLTTVKQQIERQEADRKALQALADASKGTREKPLTGRQRRSHLIEDEDDEDEVEG